MVPTGPVMLTSRFDVADGYTYDGYVRTGGYTSLRKALTEMTAADVAAQVKDATLLGRGGAGFPAGVKWGFLPPGRPAVLRRRSTATRASPAPTRTGS